MSAIPKDFVNSTGDSELVFGSNSIGELLTYLNTRRPSQVFIRWNAAPGEESWSQLDRWIRTLDPDRAVLHLSHRGGITGNALLLTDFFNIYWDGLCPDGLHDRRKQDVLRALAGLPYSELLERAVLLRLRRAKDEAAEQARRFPKGRTKPRLRTLAIATFEAGQAADEKVRKVLGWAREIGLSEPLLILGRERPNEERVEEYRFSRDSLFQDVNELFKKLSEVSPPATNTPVVSAAASHAPAPRFRRVLDILGETVRKLVDGKDAESPSRAEIRRSRWLTVQQEWAYLIARLAAPNFSVVWNIMRSWESLDVKIEEWAQELTKLGWLQPDNAEEYYTFRVRLGFLAMLRELHPEVYETAVSDPDGVDQLYRIHLILLGEAQSDSLISSALLPEWQAFLQDPLLCELFQSCFSLIRNERSLVPRFESRLQLRNLLYWLSEHSLWHEKPVRSNALATLATRHQEWIFKVANTKFEAGESMPSYDELGIEARRLFAEKPSATDALQAAQILLSADELSGESKFKGTFDDLVTAAIRASRGGIRFDATLTQARALALEGKTDSALQVLRIQKRIARDALMRLAADVEIGFAYECDGDLFRAVKEYQRVIRDAENVGADELVARAASGCLRCDKLMRRSRIEESRQLRAQIMLRIQSARSTELSPLLERKQPKIFMSYRSKERIVTDSLHEALVSTGLVTTYYDVKSPPGDDFSPAIHMNLLDADAIVLALSREFFKSPWCIHELHFALGQCDVRGVMLFWTWCETRAESEDQRCEDAVREWIEKEFARSEIHGDNYEQFHIEDRVNRLFAYGRRLTEKIVRFDASPENEQRERERLKAVLAPPIVRQLPRLYERAHLEFPANALLAQVP